MDIVKIPNWWGDRAKRPNTVKVASARGVRTRADLLKERRTDNLRNSTRFQEVPGEEPGMVAIEAGMRMNPRNYRDRATMQDHFD